MKALVFALALSALAPLRAQTAAPDAARIDHTTVAAALADLRARDGQGVIVTEAEGWVTVAEPRASAQWSFVPAGHPAYPAVVRRTIRRGPGNAASVETAQLCEAPRAACEQLLAEFEALNDRITQAVRSRGRQGSTQPVAPR